MHTNGETPSVRGFMEKKGSLIFQKLFNQLSDLNRESVQGENVRSQAVISFYECKIA